MVFFVCQLCKVFISLWVRSGSMGTAGISTSQSEVVFLVWIEFANIWVKVWWVIGVKIGGWVSIWAKWYMSLDVGYFSFGLGKWLNWVWFGWQNLKLWNDGLGWSDLCLGWCYSWNKGNMPGYSYGLSAKFCQVWIYQTSITQFFSIFCAFFMAFSRLHGPNKCTFTLMSSLNPLKNASSIYHWIPHIMTSKIG